MLNRLSFFKPTRPKLLQIGQTRYQSTPLYLYIHNIKLVCKSGTLCAELEWEIVVYTQPHINSMLNRLSLFKPTRPKLLQIGQTRYPSTPLYLYIHNIKLVCKSGTLCAGLDREIVTQPNINSMVNSLSFFKPMRPKLFQIGQTRYQSSPLYLYIHNWFVTLVHVHLCWIGTGKSSLHTVSSLTSVATVTMVPIKMTTLVGGWKNGNIHCIC